MTGLTNADMSQGENRDGCPLCKIAQREVLEEYPRWRLARTKTMKGHRERLVLFHREHLKTLDEQSIGEAYLLLMGIGSRFFSYVTEWAIFESVYATVPNHWHRVASDLDAKADDYKQILRTPRTIIDSGKGSIHRADPIEQIIQESKSKES